MAYTLPQIVQALTDAFDGDWADYAGTAPAYLDNQPNQDPPLNGAWARFGVRPSDSEIKASSGRSEDGTYAMVLEYQHGTVWLQLHMPKETGVGDGNDIIEGFRKSMSNRTLGSSFYTRQARVQHYPQKDGDWMVTVEIPFIAHLA